MIYNVVINMPPEALFNRVVTVGAFPENMWPGMRRVSFMELEALSLEKHHQGSLAYYSVDFAANGLVFQFLNKDAPLLFKLGLINDDQ